MALSATIIVAVVIVKDDKILLIQEAKESCKGQWYLPAGKMEKGETIISAAKREMKEEAGYEIDVAGVFHIEHISYGGPSWIRFSIAANIIGGELKTVPDQESLRADWFPLSDLQNNRIQLRTNDFVPLIFNVFLKNKYLIPVNFFLDKADAFAQQNNYYLPPVESTNKNNEDTKNDEKFLDNV
jgi:ADP-ribose pyrophosphatase YjhB (NUDIX family)